MSTSNNSLQQQIITGLSAGVVIGVTEVIFAVSLGVLISAGQASYVANGICLILLGGILSLLLISLFSSYKGSLSIPQDTPAAILAVMATGILQNVLSASPREKFITIAALEK